MVRYTLLVLFIAWVGTVSTRDWFKALCFALPLIAFLERPDMPRAMFGLPGLNPFNIILLFVLIGWMAQKGRDGLKWTVDKRMTWLLVLYIGVLVVATARALMDPAGVNALVPEDMMGPPTRAKIMMNGVVNGIKWVIPGLLIAHGANTPERRKLAVVAVLITGFCFSAQMIVKMLPALIGGQDLAERALRVLDRDLGYHRVDLAALTAALSWAFYAFRIYASTPLQRLMCLGGFGLCSLAMLLTGGRAGLLAWLVAGALLAYIRMRQLLILLPLAGVIAISLLPALRDRVLTGFTEDSRAEGVLARGIDTIDESGRDQYAITSGRVVVWPLVIDNAMESPLFGHGRYAMLRQGISQYLGWEYQITSFAHPHNAYLQMLQDGGLVGLGICLAFYITIGLRVLRVTNTKGTDLHTAISTVTLAYLTVVCVAMMGSQSFYPMQSNCMLWVMLGLSMAKPLPEMMGVPKVSVKTRAIPA